MGQCVDRDEPPDPRLQTDEWRSVVGVPDVEQSKARTEGLRRHFLSRAYLNGLDLAAERSGYGRELLDDETRIRVYRGRKSRVAVWDQAVDLSAPQDEDLEVVFCYMPSALFREVCQHPVLAVEVWCLLLEPPHRGAASILRASRSEPESWTGAAPAECCLPVLVPQAQIQPQRGDAAFVNTAEPARAMALAASNAERRWRRIVQFREEAEHPDVLEAVVRLAEVLKDRGKPLEVEPLLQCALRGCQERLGAADPATLSCHELLCETLRQNGRDAAAARQEFASQLRADGALEEAEELYRRSLQEREADLGAEHAETLHAANALAMLLKQRGKLAEAQEYYGRVLLGREQLLGPQHPDTLRSANNLAVLHQARGHYEAAETLYRDALQGCEARLGPRHADTITGVNNLAGLLKLRNRVEEAELLYRRALEARQAELGREHGDTITSMNNLAVLLQRREKFEEAEQLHRDALSLREARLGFAQPETLTSANNLALLLQSCGRGQEAVPLLRRMLVEAPERQASTAALSLGLLVEDPTEAEQLVLRCLRWRESHLGDHADTTQARNALQALKS